MNLKNKLIAFYTANKSIYELSHKLHLMFIILLLAHIIIITPYRYAYFDITVTYINLAEGLIFATAILLYILNKKNLSIYVSAYSLPILYSYLMIKFGFPFQTIIWFALPFIIIYLILLRENKSRIIYVIFCMLLFLIPGIMANYEFPESIIKMIQIGTLLIVPILISSFLELQDSKLISLNKNLELKFTEKKIISEKLEQKNRDLITFSHIMSHDLKQPLRSIISFSQLIKMSNASLDEKSSNYFNYIEESAKSMEILIKELLTYTKIDQETPSFTEVNIQDLTNAVHSMYRHDIENGKKNLVYDKLHSVNGDKVLLKTLFHNLISNAFKYQPHNIEGHIPTVTIKSEIENERVIIFISDNGIGISDDYRDKLFQPFERYHKASEYSGTGLGLSICKKVLDKHGASINLIETSNQGSTFRLSFQNSLS